MNPSNPIWQNIGRPWTGKTKTGELKPPKPGYVLHAVIGGEKGSDAIVIWVPELLYEHTRSGVIRHDTTQVADRETRPEIPPAGAGDLSGPLPPTMTQNDTRNHG